MSHRVEWSYVQARLQARHGERLGDSEWRMLEAAKTLGRFIEESRSTPMRRFTDHINEQMTAHTIERILRAEWRAYVAEIAAWTSSAWKPAVLWGAHVPDLIMLDRLLAGDTPGWMREDPVFGPLLGADGQIRTASLEKTPFFPLSLANWASRGLVEHWLAHWRVSWPRRFGADRQWLEKLAALVRIHVRRLARAGVEESSGPYRRELAHALTRMFRRCSGTPVAVFCHLALVALDLERLRGCLVSRRLFGAEYAEGSV